MAGLRTFDAFPKTEDVYKKKSTKGGVTSILTYVFLLFICWTEFGKFFGGYIDQQYTVDNVVRETAQINMDLYVNVKCEYIHINVRDETRDRKLAIQELKLEEMPFFIPYDSKVNGVNDIVTPELDEIVGEAIPAEFREKLDTRQFFNEDDPESANYLPNFNGCHIFGSIPVNRVRGELQITASGLGYSGKKPPIEEVNFAHAINEFSFGDFYPYIDNPLDKTARFNKEKPLSAYLYHISAIPTKYKKMGVEIDTFQYSVNDYRYDIEDVKKRNLRVIPGIFFKYNFEALSIEVTDIRITFFQFIIRLVAILSFFVFVVSWIFTIIDLLLVITLGPKWSLRYQPDAPHDGILS